MPERSQAIESLETQISELFSRARTIYAESAERFHPGMLPASYKVFATIARTHPVTASDLAETLLSDKGYISRIITELERLGFISRRPDPADRRANVIEPTALGLERLKITREPHENRLATSLQEWSVADIGALSHLLRALLDNDAPVSPYSDEALDADVTK